MTIPTIPTIPCQPSNTKLVRGETFPAFTEDDYEIIPFGTLIEELTEEEE